MTYQYWMEPEAGRFPEEALAEWQRFLGELPSRRRADGVYQIFSSREDLVEFEDQVFAVTGDEHTERAEYVQLLPHQIMLDIGRRSFPRRALREFLDGFAKRWRSRIIGTSGNEMTVEALCAEITEPDD
jgi:hypothetical protein